MRRAGGLHCAATLQNGGFQTRVLTDPARASGRGLYRSATHGVRSRVDECFVTNGAAREMKSCRTNIMSVARATLHGWPFPGDDTPGSGTLSGAFLLLTFLWQGQRKVSAAPHRGNANRPQAKQGKAKTRGTASTLIDRKQIKERPKKTHQRKAKKLP